MIEVVTVTELVMASAIETVTAADIEQSVIETVGTDVLLSIAEPTPEIIEVS